MQKILPYMITPVVRIANYFDVPEKTFWGPRRIADYELIFILKGVFEYKQQDKAWKVGRNAILCIPPNTLHTLSHIKNKGAISCIHFDLLEGVTANSNAYCPEPYPQIITKPASPDFFQHLFREISLNFANVAQDERYLTETLFKCLWAKLSRYWHSEREQRVSKKIEAITQFIKDNIHDELDRHALAEKFGYTPEYINYLFKKELGITPTQFVNHEKILLAFDMLLNRKMTIKDVAAKLNFYDQYHFSKTFKKVIGRSPSHCINS